MGKSWIKLFISGGHRVRIHDLDNDKSYRTLEEIRAEVTSLETRGLLPGKLTASHQLDLVIVHANVQECVEGAIYIQVSVYK